MSFGFSVGDFLAGAQLAYTLCKALSDAKGSTKEFQELITQLNVVHKVLLQVDQLRASNQLAQATVNALLFTVNSVNETMESFLDQNQAYLDSLKAGGSGSSVADAYRKLRWPIQMPDRVKALQQSLATMLSAVNCLLSLACYYNTGYDPRCSATMRSDVYPANDISQLWPRHDGGDIKVVATLYGGGGTCPDFATPDDKISFFRPGQVFAAQITSRVYLENGREFRKIDFGHLPLEPVTTLQEIAAKEHLEDRQKRLAQIRALPLSWMAAYSKDLPLDNNRVECVLCKRGTPLDYRIKLFLKRNGAIFSKDDWIFHFRLEHWRYYFSMVAGGAFQAPYLARFQASLIPNNEILQPLAASSFLADEWITIENITIDAPISSDEDIVATLSYHTPQYHYLSGPIMIQRFVVVAVGVSSSLCLGIHTFARQGCGGQPDPELFSVVHSGKEPHAPFPDETGLTLSPIRMKPDHPSTTLPKSARIHFGRAYAISHHMEVQPLGLVHPTSMETLLEQFEANVYRQAPGTENVHSGSSFSGRAEVSDREVKQADMEIVKQVRDSITQVLGPRLSPADYLPQCRRTI